MIAFATRYAGDSEQCTVAVAHGENIGLLRLVYEYKIPRVLTLNVWHIINLPNESGRNTKGCTLYCHKISDVPIIRKRLGARQVGKHIRKRDLLCPVAAGINTVASVRYGSHSNNLVNPAIRRHSDTLYSRIYLVVVIQLALPHTVLGYRLIILYVLDRTELLVRQTFLVRPRGCHLFRLGGRRHGVIGVCRAVRVAEPTFDIVSEVDVQKPLEIDR